MSHFGNSFLEQVGGPLSKREIPPFGSVGMETPAALVQMPQTLIVTIGTSLSADLSYTKPSSSPAPLEGSPPERAADIQSTA